MSDKVCAKCKHFKVATDVEDPVIPGVGDCFLWEEGLDPDDTCDEWVENEEEEVK